MRAHLESCPRCRARAGGLGAAPALAPNELAWRPVLADIDARAHGGVGRGVPAHARPARAGRRIGRLFATVSSAVAVAAVLVIWARVQRTPSSPPPGERVKGNLTLAVHVKRANGAIDEVVGDGVVRPGEEMRFSVASAAPGYAAVLGVDSAPSVTVYVPGAGPDQRAPRLEGPERTVLPGSVVADATPGAERVFAVVCPREPDVEVLRRGAQEALAAAGGRPEAVATLGSGCGEVSVLLRKQ